MLNAVKGGQLNGAKLINNDALDQVTGAGYTLNPFELDWTGLLLLDRDGTMNPALEDVKVRQAINYAFDSDGAARGGRQGPRHPDRADLPDQFRRPMTRRSTPSTRTTRPRPSSCWPRPDSPNGFTLDMPNTARTRHGDRGR